MIALRISDRPAIWGAALAAPLPETVCELSSRCALAEAGAFRRMVEVIVMGWRRGVRPLPRLMWPWLNEIEEESSRLRMPFFRDKRFPVEGLEGVASM